MENDNMIVAEEALKGFLNDNEIFAALFNAYFFGGDEYIDPSELESIDPAGDGSYLIKKGKTAKYVLYCRANIQYDMPVLNFVDATEEYTKDPNIPVISLVFYTGKKKWDGSGSLIGLMAPDNPFLPFISDWKMFLLEIISTELRFNNEKLERFRKALISDYSGKKYDEETELDPDILSLIRRIDEK